MDGRVEEQAKSYYDEGKLTKAALRRMVAAGKLSQAAYKRITGETYKA